MPVNFGDLKSQLMDYYWAHWEDGELVMEPFCACGNALEEDYFCQACKRECDCSFIACEDPEVLDAVEKLVHGNPTFRNFRASLLVR